MLDWPREAKEMGAVYERSLLTIAAIGSPDSNGSLYHADTRPAYTSPLAAEHIGSRLHVLLLYPSPGRDGGNLSRAFEQTRLAVIRTHSLPEAPPFCSESALSGVPREFGDAISNTVESSDPMERDDRPRLFVGFIWSCSGCTRSAYSIHNPQLLRKASSDIYTGYGYRVK